MPEPNAKAAPMTPEQEEAWNRMREQIPLMPGLPSDVRCVECGAKPAWFGHHPTCSQRALITKGDQT